MVEPAIVAKSKYLLFAPNENCVEKLGLILTIAMGLVMQIVPETYFVYNYIISLSWCAIVIIMKCEHIFSHYTGGKANIKKLLKL